MSGESYHARRAREEWHNSLAAAAEKSAQAHRELSVLHLRRLMASADDQSRREAEQIIALLDTDSAATVDDREPAPMAAARRKRLRLRFG